MAEILTPQVRDKGLEILLEYPPDLPSRFTGDAGRIRRVATNLVGNAIKFTPSGRIPIAVECDGKDAELARMRVSITDTGIGIPREKTASLFEKFSRADDSVTRKYGGTGLGLAISKQVVEPMGGAIGIRSEPGEGSNFLVHTALAWSSLPGCGLIANRPPGTESYRSQFDSSVSAL